MIRGFETPCTVENCNRLVGRKGAKGMCSAHYKRSLNGKKLKLEDPIQDRGAGWISTHGYRYIGSKSEHRRVMEDQLGRSLTYNEIIHHKDGNTLNNDLSNLEVMDRGDHVRLHNSRKTNEQRAVEKKTFGFVLPSGLGGKP